jgi:alpha-mannosidase
VIERPTHRNTTIDQAKFEVCAHGFADFSEATCGVAIASRDKYGYIVEGNVLRLSLVRAPTSPDPETDQGKHEIEFAIIPHQGQLAGSQVQTEALKFNNRPHGMSLTELTTDRMVCPLLN